MHTHAIQNKKHTDAQILIDASGGRHQVNLSRFQDVARTEHGRNEEQQASVLSASQEQIYISAHKFPRCIQIMTLTKSNPSVTPSIVQPYTFISNWSHFYSLTNPQDL